MSTLGRVVEPDAAIACSAEGTSGGLQLGFSDGLGIEAPLPG